MVKPEVTMLMLATLNVSLFLDFIPCCLKGDGMVSTSSNEQLANLLINSENPDSD